LKSIEKEAAEKLLSAFSGYYVSRREGLTVVKIAVNGKTVIVWLRKSPVTPKSLALFWKIAEKHGYDEVVLYKLTPVADYPRFEELKKLRIIKSIDELAQG